MQSDVNERVKDLVTAGLLLMVGIGGFLFVNPKGVAVTPGPGGLTWRSLPFIYSGLLIGLTLVYALVSFAGLLRALKERDTAPSIEVAIEDAAHSRLSNQRRLATVGCLVAYALALPQFGSVAMTPLLLVSLFYVFGRTNHLQNLALAIGGGSVLSLLFIGILKLPLRGSTLDPLTPMLSNLLRSMGL